MSKSQSCGKRRGMLEQNSGCVGAFIVLPVVSNFNTSLVQLDEKVPIVPIIPELVWHKMLLILQMSPMGVQWNLFTVLIIQRHNFFINCIPNIIEGKKGFSKLGSYVSIFAVMSKISCDVIYQCFRGPHSRSSAEKNTIVKNH